MQYIIDQLQSFYDQLNPFSTGNIVLYYVWLVAYSATLVSTWRARSTWSRLFSFIANQVLQIGVLMSWSLTAILAVHFWLPSLLIFVAVVSTTFYVLRER